MGKRLLNCTASDFLTMNAHDLKQAIVASEGRTICSENVVMHEPMASDCTSAEVARAFGADLILLNIFDCFHPLILGMDGVSVYNMHEVITEKKFNNNIIQDLKKLVGRPIGVNLEPVDTTANMLEDREFLSEGRKCTIETLQAAEKLGFDFICLTGNPGTGVTNQTIIDSIQIAKQHFSGLIIAGKMHGAGVDEAVASIKSAEEIIHGGADILLVPAVGTVPGFSDSELTDIVKLCKANHTLVMSTIGTSQESSRPETIREIAIRNKVAGVDIQHIGDSGYNGIANIENIFELSVAIRGMRHTVSMISKSINR